ncbi:transcription termination/antitermination NusG family protein [Hydrogenivirga sp. 128-5-R1-1]|uniref:transcription termination/antitermination NusG family protein n=1 Tax=Hydrogenivirga sp. 128-5-R1-1 TaxID=392423 RepID=UPI00015F180F|nr:transcription termination/antitermination NusG family protein [Hydrogenivirga sp. 128-5-R1-1]EDP75380.1 transcription antitermination protein NusG [Hydrogenivirga sp. 128-5-R1-1]
MWYVLKVRSGKEEALKELLGRDFEVLYPSRKKLNVYVNGKKRYSFSLSKDKDISVRGVNIRIRDGEVFTDNNHPDVRVVISDGESPLRGYLFVKGRYEDILSKTENLLDVVGFLIMGGKVRTLTDEEVSDLQKRVEKGERLKTLLPERGMRVKVVSGEWTGAEGVIEEVYEDLSLKLKLRLWDKTFTAILPLERVILL